MILSVRRTVVWALMAMEMAVTFPLLSALAGTPDDFSLFLGPLLAEIMMPLGYAAFDRIRWLRRDRPRLAVGIIISLAVRLVITPFPTGGDSVTENVFNWLLVSLLPVIGAVALWWRGGFLADSDLTAEDVRGEFPVLAVILVIMMSVYRSAVTSNVAVSVVSVTVFLMAGMVAVGVSRQDAARSPVQGSARALVATAVLVPVLFGALLVVVLKPEIAIAFWTGVENLIDWIIVGIAYLLTPLLSLINLGALNGNQQRTGIQQTDPNMNALADQAVAPWLVWLVTILVIVIGLVLIIGLLYALFAILLPAWGRTDERSARDPVEVDTVDGAAEDALALLAGLGRLLSRATAPLSDLGLRGSLRDARMAYRVLLRWAAQRGLAHRPAESTHEWQQRLDTRVPAGSPTFDLLTRAYELERYGDHAASQAVLRDLETELKRLSDLEVAPRT